MTELEVAARSFFALDRNGRFLSGRAFDRLRPRLASASRPITDAFVFCSGGIEDPAEARAHAARFFGLLQRSLEVLGDWVTPLGIAIHWPSGPFPENGSRELLAHVDDEIPLGPEEEAELDALLQRTPAPDGRKGCRRDPIHGLSLWLTKKRAGEVGERFGREHLAPLWAECPPACRPRLHLIGHSFGARLLTSAVLGGARPESLTLLQAAFSAFAFAEEIPGARGPGYYHRILAERLVAGRIVAVRSIHDPALATLYPRLTGGFRGGRPGRLGRKPGIVAASALGIVGARGAGAPELEIREAQRLGLPLRPIVNVEASALIAGHQDILHPEVATIALMASGLLIGGPDGPRSRPERLTPVRVPAARQDSRRESV
jgi:hypothetical protein